MAPTAGKGTRMTNFKDSATDPQSRQKRLPAPDRLPLAPAYADDQAPIAALLKSIANEISQSDQRQGNALADLRARLNLLTERQPSADVPPAQAVEPPREHVARQPSGVAKPVLALEDRSAEAATPKVTPRAPFRQASEPVKPQAPADHPAKQLPAPQPAAPARSLDAIYASVAQSYAEAARQPKQTARSAPVRSLLPPRLQPQSEPVADDDGDFLDMSALAEAYAPKPVRVPERPAPAAKSVARPAVAHAPLAASPVVEASIAVDKSIDELAGRIAQTEKKIDLALAQPADSPAIAAITAHVEALRSDLERLMAEHDKVSEAVGLVSANVSALSQSAAQLGPMSDSLGHLNEAILSLRQDLPQVFEQTAERAQSHVIAAMTLRGENPELAEKLAIVQNLLLSRAVEQRESDTRSHGALETIRDLVQNLHHRIDAMEAGDEAAFVEPETAAAPTAAAAPMGPRVVHSAPQGEQPNYAPGEPDKISAASLSREDLIASARRAAMAVSHPKPAAAQTQPAAQPEQPRSATADLRTLAVGSAPQKSGGIFDLLRSPIGLVAMVVLTAISLGMIYAKVMRKPAQPAAPKVVIEQSIVPDMPADLPDALAGAAPAKPKAAAANATPAPAPAAPKPADKSSALSPDDTPAANASTLADAGVGDGLDKIADAIVETASTAVAAPAGDALPAAIAPLSQRTAALAGDPAATYLIADRYLKGAGIARDPAKASHWFEQSAKAGSALAEFKLGVMNEKGDGVTADAPRAMDWYRASANHGNVQAMHNLAVLFTAQAGGSPDYPEAAKWFEQAANFGLKDSQYNLAVLNANGLGLPKDAGKAYKWFSIAAARGDADAGKQRDTLRKSLLAGKAAEVDAEIKAWRAKPQDRKANTADTLGVNLGEAAPAIGNSAANDIGAVQKMLSQLGYDPGTLDGTLTGQTRDAIRTFQGRSGMPATGEIDEALTAKLKGLAG